jgi:TonB family protein
MTTMIADPPRKTSLGVGFEAQRGRGTTEAWKQSIGNKPIPARLALLPEQKTNWTRVGTSAAVQVSILVFFILVPLLYPEGMKTALQFYSATPLEAPPTMVPVAPPPPPPPKMKTPPPPKAEVKPPTPVEPPKLNPQQPHVFANLATPKAVQPKIEKTDVKEPDIKAPVFDNTPISIKENGPKRPKEDVKTGNLGSAAPATVKAPVDKVQTGGFGDENGLPGKGDPNHATNVNRLGSPALPGGEGYGNGTGGKNGQRGTVASTGFGNGTATPPVGSGKPQGTVATGGFGSLDTSNDPAKKKTGPTGPADTRPEILEKPKPEYTAEGRNLKIEGDVVISLVFKANGTIQINKVVSGLGHGLDESAVHAAEQIKFKPAKLQNEPVDFPATVRIVFQLAY